MRTLIGSTATLAAIFAIFFGGWLLSAGCSHAHIFVTNQSGTTLSNLTVSGSCGPRHLNILAPQSEWRTHTAYHEGEISFSFDSAGVTYRTNVGVHNAFLGLIYTIGTNMIIKLESRG